MLTTVTPQIHIPDEHCIAALLAQTVLPEGTKLPPDIAHCSLARFSKAIDLDEAMALTSTVHLAVDECIEQFVLIKDLGPPDFNNVPLEVYPLGG